MIEEIDGQVRDWFTSIAPQASISFALPPAEGEQLTLHAYLFDIDRPLAVPSGRIPPMQLRLSYLVAVSGPDAVAAHAVLGNVISGADAKPQFALEFGEAAAAAWKAVHLPARAGFVLRATALKERSGRIAPAVRTARIDAVPLESLSGRVVAKDGTPLAGAVVEAPSIGRSVTTDANGRFKLEGVTSTLDLSLRARAKGAQTESTRPAHAREDFTITVDVMK
jgi:hypothetical protein